MTRFIFVRLARLTMAFSALLRAGTAQMISPPPLDPFATTAPSGHFSLWINPSHPDGAGSAFYRLSKDGKSVWSKDLPFTLSAVELSDDGRIGGYATAGWLDRDGSFEVVILNAVGETLLDEKHPLVASKFVDSSPDPVGEGVIMNAANDQLIIRVRDTNFGDFQGSVGEAWWTYRLSTGTPGEIIHPKESMGKGISSIFRAEALQGTPLILLDWRMFDDQFGERDFVTLVDAHAKPVWRQEVPIQQGISPRKAGDEGSILSVQLDSRFDLRFAKSGKRVSFRASQTPTGWTVEETGRTEYRPPTKPARLKLAAPPVSLRLMRRWTVPEGSGHLNPIRDVQAFQFMGSDRVAILRGGNQPAVVVTTTTGRVMREVPLPGSDRNLTEIRVLAWVGGSRLIFIRSVEDKPEWSRAWAIDAKTGKMTPLPKFSSAPVRAIAGFQDGRFAVVANDFLSYTIDEQIGMFDREGKLLWIHRSGGAFGQEPGELQGPADILVDSKQHLAVLNQADTIQFFDAKGRYLRQIDFKKSVHGGDYMTHFALMRNGRYSIADLDEAIDGYREVDGAGKVGKAVTPRLADGKQLSSLEVMQTDSSGRLWVTNGEGIFRISATGRVDGSLGEAPSSRGLSSIQEATVLPTGTVIILDRLSAEVHYFDAQGKTIHIAKPLASDYTERPPQAGPLGVTLSGDVYVGPPGECLHYSPTGERIGKQTWVKGEPALNPATVQPQWRWERDWLIDEHGNKVGKLDRWPDLAWMLDGPSAIAPDGSLMAFGGKGDRWLSAEPDRIAFFSPTGTPEGMSPLPSGLGRYANAAYDGKLAFFARKGDVVAINKQGQALWRFNLPPNPTGSWSIFPSRDGIALWDGKVTVYWYATP